MRPLIRKRSSQYGSNKLADTHCKNSFAASNLVLPLATLPMILPSMQKHQIDEHLKNTKRGGKSRVVSNNQKILIFVIKLVLVCFTTVILVNRLKKKIPKGKHIIERINQFLLELENNGRMRKVIGMDTSIVNDYPEFQILQENQELIRNEVESLLQHHKTNIIRLDEIGSSFKHKSGKGFQYPDWKVLFFAAGGQYVPQNMHFIPRTAELVHKHIPHVQNAFISILDPHQYIAPHWGVYKGLVRLHYGIMIPNNNFDEVCFMRVNSDIPDDKNKHNEVKVQKENSIYIQNVTKYYWKENESVMLDDTFLHDVRNDADTERVILIIDVPRKMPWYCSMVNHFFLWVAGNFAKEIIEIRQNAVLHDEIVDLLQPSWNESSTMIL